MKRSPSTMTHMWLSPGTCGRRCPPVSFGWSSSAVVCAVWGSVRSVQRWGVDGFELGGLLEEHDHAGQPDAEHHRTHPERDRAVPREGTCPRDEHGDGEDLGDDLPHADVGQPLREDLVSVVENRDRKGEVRHRETPERPDVGEQAEVVEEGHQLRIPAGPERRGEEADGTRRQPGREASAIPPMYE